ncbi:MAG: hypothetical protein IT437_01645 [Phycisphaerales bacterium]|nr:hypothetical protein [Phycisphaerales bacterium]
MPRTRTIVIALCLLAFAAASLMGGVTLVCAGMHGGCEGPCDLVCSDAGRIPVHPCEDHSLTLDSATGFQAGRCPDLVVVSAPIWGRAPGRIQPPRPGVFRRPAAARPSGHLALLGFVILNV